MFTFLLIRSRLFAHSQTNLGLYSITAVILLDSAGNCILSKYYDPLHPSTLPSSEQKKATGPGAGGAVVPVPSAATTTAGNTANSTLQGFANPFKNTKDQRAFEKGVFEKTRKGSGELPGTRDWDKPGARSTAVWGGC